MFIKHHKKVTRTRRNVNIAAALGAATFALTAVPGHAAVTGSEKVQVDIPVVELATREGISKAYTRLETAAERACMNDGIQTLEERRFSKACYSDLMEDFIKDAGNKELTAYHKRVKQG